MTAYTSAVAGDVNVATNWTPNGIPSFANGDTVTINKVMTIPAGFNFDAGIIAISGTSISNRAGLNVYGTLTITQDAPVNNHNTIAFFAGSVLDCKGSFGLRYSTATSTDVNNRFTADSAGLAPIIFTRSDYVSGEPPAAISATSVTVSQGGLFDLNGVVINKMFSVRYGGGTPAGNHVRVRNTVFDSAGYFQTTGFSRTTDDFIFENVDVRHSHENDIASAFIMLLDCQRQAAATPTGTKRIKNLTIKLSDERSAKYIRGINMDYCEPISFVAHGAVVSLTSINTPVSYTNVCGRWTLDTALLKGSIAGDMNDSVYLLDATDYVLTGSFHAFETQKIRNFYDNYCEEIFLQSGLDGSDWFAIPASGACNVSNNIMVLQNGGVFCNTWKSDTSATVTIEHNTVLSKTSSATLANPYGMLVRNESGNKFTGGTCVVQSNLVGVFNTSSSSDGYIAAINLTGGVALADQIDTMDYNNYYNMSPSPPTGLFPGVNSTTKAIGDEGYGANDLYESPDFENWPVGNSPIIAFAASKSLANTKTLWDQLIRLNGFNEITRRQEVAHKIDYGVAEILDFCRTCVTPSNPLLAASAHDGTSRGAVQFTPSVDPEGDRGITAIGLTAVGLTASSFTARGL